MKAFLWIAGSFFVILFGFIVGIFLAPLLASLTGFEVCIIPLIIAVLSYIIIIPLDIIYKKEIFGTSSVKRVLFMNKADRETYKTANKFYYPGLLVPIFLCSALIAIHSGNKFEDRTYDSKGIIRCGYYEYYNRLGVKLFSSYSNYFYAYDKYGEAFICCYRYDDKEDGTSKYSDQTVISYRKNVSYKIYTLDGTLVKSGDNSYYYEIRYPSHGSRYYEYRGNRYNYEGDIPIYKDIRIDIAKSMDLIPE